MLIKIVKVLSSMFKLEFFPKYSNSDNFQKLGVDYIINKTISVKKLISK